MPTIIETETPTTILVTETYISKGMSIEINAKDKCNSSLWDPITASSGRLYMVVDGFKRGYTPGVVYENYVAVTIGVNYYFQFDYYADISNASTPRLEVFINGTSIGSTTGTAGAWSTFTGVFNATAGGATVEIKQMNTGRYDDYGIDNIILSCEKR